MDYIFILVLYNTAYLLWTKRMGRNQFDWEEVPRGNVVCVCECECVCVCVMCVTTHTTNHEVLDIRLQVLVATRSRLLVVNAVLYIVLLIIVCTKRFLPWIDNRLLLWNLVDYVCLLHYFYYKDKNRKTPPTIHDMFGYSYCVWLYYWKYKGFFRMHLISRSVSDGQDCILSLLASSSLLVVMVLDNSIPCCCCCRWCCRFFFLSAQSSNDWYSLEHGPSDSLLIFFTASVFAIL